MQVSKWGNSLAIRLPAAVVEALALRAGDEIEVVVADRRLFEIRKKPGRDALVERLRAFRGRLPADFVFDREDAHARSKAPRAFIDTNVLVYLFSADARKAARAEEILKAGGVISVQVLNELASVARRKQALTWAEIDEALGLIRSLCPVVPLTVEIHDQGRRLAERHGLSVDDALIVAAARLHDCQVLFSEDMQDGLLVDERMRIRNPFREDVPSS